MKGAVNVGDIVKSVEFETANLRYPIPMVNEKLSLAREHGLVNKEDKRETESLHVRSSE
jgi:hypothetical protein